MARGMVDAHKRASATRVTAALTVVGYGGRMLADAPLRELPLLDPLPMTKGGVQD